MKPHWRRPRRVLQRCGLWAGLAAMLLLSGCPRAAEPLPDEPPEDVYLLPYAAGQRFLLVQGNFGVAGYGSHAEQYALDFAMPQGTPVLAIRSGTVSTTRADCPDVQCPFEPGTCCGNFVRVRHDDGTEAQYLHLRPGGVCVSAGQRVARGQQLGFSGNTGRSLGPHLHLAVFAGANEPADGRFGPSRNGTLEIRFADVPGGVPEFLRAYTSGNTPRDACEAQQPDPTAP